MAEISYAEAERLAYSGRFADAEKMTKKLLKAFPDSFSLQYLLSSINLLTGRYKESRRICNMLLSHPEVNADVYNTLAAISMDQDGDLDQAGVWLRKALSLDPNHRKTLVNLGHHYLRSHALRKAQECFQRATSESEPHVEAINGLGLVELAEGHFEKAISTFETILQYEPNNIWALCHVLEAMARATKIEESIELAIRISRLERPAIASVPAFTIAKLYCVWDLADQLLPAALHELNKAPKLFTMFLLATLPLLTTHGFSNKKLFDLHCSVAQVFRRLCVQPPFSEYPAAFKPSKRIRIGYFSADLRHHVVTRFFRSLINYRDRSKFEIFLYSAALEKQEDSVTTSYIKASDHFIRVADMSDIEIANRIHADGIHILVELGGYTAGTRIEVLVYRPAPVQISYLGYPFTYGLEEVDYAISDPWLAGPKAQLYFVENLLKLPESFITVDELPEHEIALKVPVLRNGYVTFGSMNNIYKLNVPTIALWSRILHRVPGSKIYLNHPNLSVKAASDKIIQTFARYGISADRVIIVFKPHPQGGVHVLYYNEIDIALDTLPLTGGTTTVEALWMGVPVVTLVGDTHAQRLSYSIIKNSGMNLDDCIAFTEDEYLERAVALAENPQRITDIRQKVPKAMRSGIFGDPVRFTSHMETAYFEAWDKKFPESPIASILLDEVAIALPIGDNCQLVVHDLPDDIYAYVLNEQGKWFEAEYEFLVNNAGLFKVFWDFAEDPGVYAIPVAKAQSVSGGTTLTIRDNKVSISLLQKSIAHNHLDNIQVLHEPEYNQVLHNQVLPDLVRFSLDYNDRTGAKVGRWIDAFEASSPLILASLRNPEELDLSTYNLLCICGYMPYRLLPGYGLLVPHQKEDVIGLSNINLFFCKPDMAEKLEQQGVLCRTIAEMEDVPSLEIADLWHESLPDLTYATTQMQAWAYSVPAGQWGTNYLLALNLDRQGRIHSITPGKRWASIKQAQTIFISMMEKEITVPRLLSGVRVMADSGERELATRWAALLYESLKGKSGPIFNEPWLSPLKEFETLPMADDAIKCARTLAMAAHERLHSFSSWFTAAESLEMWQRISGEALMDIQAKRMTELIQKRFVGKTEGIS
jgi:predicted O-linked N-acetylglucosamine transferase (SPINDLY family)